MIEGAPEAASRLQTSLVSMSKSGWGGSPTRRTSGLELS